MQHDEIGIFAAAFVLSALAGVAALLRSRSKATPKSIATASLNSGLLGLGVSLVWYERSEDVYFLIGLCVLVGLGGQPTMNFVLAVARKAVVAALLGKKGDNEGD